MMRRFLIPVVFFATVVVATSMVLADDRDYTFYEIGSLGECRTGNEARDINDQGFVAGKSGDPDCLLAAATIWFNGEITNLQGTFEGGLFRSGWAISEIGNVVGTGDTENALIYRDGMTTALALAPECEYNLNVEDINRNGTVAVGSCCTDNSFNIERPVVYSTNDNTALVLDLLPGMPRDADGRAVDANDLGVVIGFNFDSISGDTPAFIWSDGELTELENSLGGKSVAVGCITNSGWMSGYADATSGAGAMRYNMNTGTMSILGPGVAVRINELGVAVGFDIIDLSAAYATLYENGETTYLHEFLPANWTYSSACAINNYGWIVGDTEDEDGNDLAWLLVPVYDKGDYDGDGDVDHQDFANFQRCFAAEPYIDGTLHVGCSVFDFDDDVDLDLADYAAFQSAFTGPTAPNLNPNGPG